MFQCFNKIYYLQFLSLLLFAGSCIGYKKTLYFQGNQTEVIRPNSTTTYTLQAGDVIMVKLFTPDSKSAEMFDMNSKSTAMTPAGVYFNGYAVSDSGYVDLPLAGQIYVVGYTIQQIDSIVTAKAKDYFNYSSVDVKLASFKFMAVGEFKQPGYTYVYNNKCTIIEAISLAGDATDFANKEKVTVVRQIPNQPDKIYKLNLTDYSYYNSEAFYIQPNDVIYIQPQKAKVDSRNIQYLTLGLAALSTILLVINYIK